MDEAQLVPELAVAVKRFVDTLGTNNQFMLTGSAVVGRGTLGGSDPLAGRSARIQLRPFTGAELAASEDTDVPSLPDLLFDAPLSGVTVAQIEQAVVVRDLREGGIPAYCLGSHLTPSSLRARVQADVIALTRDQLLPEETFDGARAGRVLDALVRTPGGILNKSRFASDLGIDVRTFSSYLDLLERRFLVTTLPKLGAGPGSATRSRPKVHPADTSIAVESLFRGGHDIAAEPELLGQVLESWVACQVVASLDWAAAVQAMPFYWRDAKTGAEVDLVLRDETGRIVGVEVKAASSLSRADTRGLMALSHGPGMHRGFIVYRGAEMAQLAPGIWALPLAMVEDPRRWPTTATVRSSSSRVEPQGVSARHAPDSDASLFLSYVHADDDYMEGALVAFAHRVAAAYSYLTGREIELFVDREDIAWGQAWQERITNQLGQTSFLLAMVTPNYIRSKACRDEVVTFLAGPGRQDCFLTLMVRDPDATAADVAGNPAVTSIMSHISAHQYLKPDKPLETLIPGSPEFRDVAQQVAEKLRTTAENISRTGAPGTSNRPAEPTKADSDDSPGLLDVAEHMQRTTLPDLSGATQGFKIAMDDFSLTFGHAISGQGDSPAKSQRMLIVAASRMENDRKKLDDATTTLADTWNEFDNDMKQLVALAADESFQVAAPEIGEAIQGITLNLDPAQFHEMRLQVQELAKLSRALRPVSQTLGRALDVVDTVRCSMSAWEPNVQQ